MRKFNFILLALLMTAAPLFAQENINQLGRWGEGYCEAIFRRSGYTFIGNGAYLQVYQTRYGEFQLLDEILLPATIRDIWVRSDLTYIYLACGQEGLQIVSFDPMIDEFIRITGSVNTAGFSNGLILFGNYLYIADGSNGMQVVDIANPFSPVPRGRYQTSAPAHEVWIANDTTALVAADVSGLFAIDIKNPYYPLYMDSLRFPTTFPEYPAKAYSILRIDTVGYVAAGHGGMFTVNLKDPTNMQIIGQWSDTVPVDVRHVWVAGQNAYLACGEDGYLGPINISDPTNPGDLFFLPLNTDGSTLDIVVSQDTAYICDGSLGMIRADVDINNPPAPIDTVATSDKAYDVTISGNYAYTATGKTGLNVHSINFQSPRSDSLHLDIVDNYNTSGEARGVVKSGNFVYVADGSQGLVGLYANPPSNLTFEGQYAVPGDTAFAVAVPSGSKAYIACGETGFRVINISGTYFQLGVNDTPVKCLDIKVKNDTAFVADKEGGVRLYNVYNPVNILPVKSYSINMDARGIDVSGSKVFVANGIHGILIWDVETDSLHRIETSGVCTDIDVKQKTIYATVSGQGLRIYDFSLPGQYPSAGYFPTGETPQGVYVDENSNKVCVADGKDGLYVLNSTIQPQISITPTALNFGTVPPDFSRPMIVWVNNTGSTELKVNRIIANKSEFKFDATSFSVAPGTSHRLEVRFEPTNLTPIGVTYDGSASIQSNADTLSLSLQGQVEPLAGEGEFNPDYFTRALYHCNESEGTFVDDASANNLNGTLHGTVSHSETAKFNRSLNFDGETGWMEVPYSSLLNFQNQNFTVELWFYMNQKPSGKAILLRRGDYDSNTRQYELTLEEGSRGLTGSVWTGTTTPVQHEVISGSIAELNTQQWYHAALTWDGDSLRLYLNDILKDKKQVRGSLFNDTSEPLAIGASSKVEAPYSGLIDEIRISGVARQPWEFNVNRSRLAADKSVLEFGNVLRGYFRKVPLKLSNTGSQPLTVSSITSTNSAISASNNDGFILGVGGSTTIWVTYAPESEETLDTEDVLIIQSTDPTFPNYNIALEGNVITGLPAGAYETDPFTIGLYHMDEALGSTVYDSSGHEMDGRVQGTILRDDLTRKFGSGRSIRLDSNDDRVIITPESYHHIGTAWGGFTVEGWFYFSELPATGYAMLANRGRGLSRQFQMFVDYDGNITAEVYNTESLAYSVNSESTTEIQEGSWYHIAMTLSIDTLRLYLNGNLIDQAPISGTLAGGTPGTPIDTLSIILGNSWDGAEPFTGHLDEFRISGIERQRWEYNVVMARIDVSQAELEFGHVLVNRQRELKLWVSNPGIDILQVDSISSSNPASVFTDTSTFSVTPGDSQLVRVRFSPREVAPVAGQLTFWTNDPFWKTRPLFFDGQVLAERGKTAYTADPFTLALYHMNEGTGTVVSDSSGGANHGNFSGDVSWSSNGRFGQCLRFNSSEEWIEFPDNGSLDFQNKDFTIEFWFSMAQRVSGYATLLKRGSGANQQFEILLTSIEDAGLIAYIWDETGEMHTLSSQGFSELNLNQWYHAALLQDSDSLFLSLNNVITDTLVLSSPIQDHNNGTMTLGGTSESGYLFNGYLDELHISNIRREPWALNVIEPTIQVFPTQLHFATVLVDESRTLQLYIKNSGDQRLDISDISGIGDLFTMTDTPTSFSLNRLETRAIPITYTPDEADVTHSSVLTITSNDTTAETIIVNMEGSGSNTTGQNPYTTDAHTMALYHFDGITGDTTITDDSGWGYYGSLKNGAVFTPYGYFTFALRFDGKDDYGIVESTNALSFDLYEESYSIEFYFRTDTVNQTLLSSGYYDNGYAPNYRISIDGAGRISVSGFGSGGLFISDGSWHHLAFTYNHLTRQGRMYIDGTLQWTKTWISPDHISLNHPLILGAYRNAFGQHLNFFKGDIDEMRISDITREPWEFQLVDNGVTIMNMHPAVAAYNNSLTLTVYVPVALNASEVSLMYRPGGGSTYEKLVTTKEDSVTYQVQIPAENLSLRGLEYYIQISNAQNIQTYPVMDAQNNPIAQVIRHDPEMETPVTFYYKQFQMFSIPFDMDNTTVASILEDDLGQYDPYKWRLFWWQRRDSVYIEYKNSTSAYFDFEPGRSYWMTTSKEKKFDIDKFETVSTDSAYPIPVYAGWNMVSNPFNFDISWNDCTVSSDSVLTLTYYDNMENGYRNDWSTLSPWGGYWLYNADLDTIPEKLYVRPKEKVIAKSAPVRNGVLSDTDKEEWSIRLSASTDGATDLDNYAGVRISSKEEWDIKDRPEPPPMGDYITLYFDHSDWKQYSGTFAVDMRESGKSGYIWHFNIETRYSNQNIAVNWNLINNLPKDWEIYIFDLTDGISYDCSKETALAFNSDKAVPNVRNMKLVAGTKEFIQNHNDGIPLEPVQFHLFQNYPNPFNLETTIKYSLPKNDHVKIIVYNAIGQEVAVLLNKEMNSGHHEIIWNGRDKYQKQIPSGVYIYQIKTADHVKTRKMVLIK